MDEDDVRREARRERSANSGKFIGIGIVLLALLFFVGQNRQRVPIEWLFFSFTAPLWLMLILAALAGAVLGAGLRFVLNRRERRERRD